MSKRIGVIGGGISGLATAFYLRKYNFEVVLFEKNRPGGVIESQIEGGTVFDMGPNSLRDRDGLIHSMISELGLEKNVITISEAFKSRCIIRNGELQYLRPSFLSFLASPVLSLSSKLRLLKEPFVNPGGSKDESVRSFLERRLGKEAVDYLVDPIFSGIYAGDISRLSKSEILPKLAAFEDEYGSIAKGFFAQRKNKSAGYGVINFTGGIQTLTDTLSEQLSDSMVISEVSEIRSEGSGNGYTLKAGEESYEVDGVVSCVPAYELSRLVNGMENDPSAALDRIDYTPMLSVQLEFERSQINEPAEGFGFLVPRREGYRVLGSIWKSSIFPELVNEDRVLFNLLCGGAHDPLTEDEITEAEEMIIREFKKLMNIDAIPVSLKRRYWNKALPQLNTGYSEIREQISKFESSHRNFLIGGNFRWGVSVPDCIKGAKNTARALNNA